MTTTKSLIFFLILLLIIQPGCTVTSYYCGRDFSEKHPIKVKYNKVDDMQRGDVVELTMNDDTVHIGQLVYYKENEFIGLTELDAEINLDTYNEMEVYEWNNIKKIRRANFTFWTGFFMTAGFLTDLTLILGFFVLKALGEALSNLS